MANFGRVAAEIDSGVWGTPANFNGFSRLAFVTAATSLTGGQPNSTLHDVWPCPGLVRYIYIFGGSCPLMGFCQVQKYSLYGQVLRSCVTARHSSSGRQPNCDVKQRAPPIFGRAAITVGIGPHSSCF